MARPTFIKFILSRHFWMHLLFIVLAAIFTFWLIFRILNVYTHHGKSVAVPSLTDLSLEQAEDYLKQRNLSYKVSDSSYSADRAPNTVLSQEPKPNSWVKKNRRIYLTVNSNVPPQVGLPDIMGASLRNATTQLESVGLKVGKTSYIPDIAQNAVLGIRYKGEDIDPGKKIIKGSSIDLVLGDGGSFSQIAVPDLRGETYKIAKLQIRGSNLAVGSTIEEGIISNPEQAIVVRQLPEPGIDATIRVGEPIDLWIQENPNPDNSKIFIKPPSRTKPKTKPNLLPGAGNNNPPANNTPDGEQQPNLLPPPTNDAPSIQDLLRGSDSFEPPPENN